MPGITAMRAPYISPRTPSWDQCLKNPGHNGFIPVKQFRREHLPVEYRHESVMTRIRLLSDLSCRLFVGCKSIHRPGNRRLFRDVSNYRYATGNVVEIIKTNLPRTQKCNICNSLYELTEGTYVIRIMTACHVVFDCKEAEKTIIDLFYDDEVNLKDIKTLHGFCMVSRNVDEDQCIFECTTDDFDLVTLLENKLSSLQKLVRECSFIYYAPCNIIASHPHGMSKHISVGAWRFNAKHEKFAQHLRNIRKRFFEFFPLLHLSFLTHLVSNIPESECVSIECDVSFPDKTTQKCHIWQWDDEVRCTKAFLIKEGNLPGDPDQFHLVLELPDEETQVMQDDKCLDYYMEDLSKVYRIVVKRNNEILTDTD